MLVLLCLMHASLPCRCIGQNKQKLHCNNNLCFLSLSLYLSLPIYVSIYTLISIWSKEILSRNFSNVKNKAKIFFILCKCRESEDEYSDDDDMSWKVRRSAAKCLEAVVSTRHDMLPEFYKTVSPALIARFKGDCLSCNSQS